MSCTANALRRWVLTLSMAWLSAQGVAWASEAGVVERGHQVYGHWCLPCHGPGQHTPGTMALYFKYQGQKQPMLEFRDDLNPQLIAAFVRNGVSVMPTFRKTEISDANLAALSAYLAVTAQGPKPPLPPFPPPGQRP